MKISSIGGSDSVINGSFIYTLKEVEIFLLIKVLVAQILYME